MKHLAKSFHFNSRGLEEHWRTTFAELLRILLPPHLIVQEEGTQWSFNDTTKNPTLTTFLDRTLPLGQKEGFGRRPDVRVLFFHDNKLWFPLLVENKKAIPRFHSLDFGWPCTERGRSLLVASLGRAVTQAEWQAVMVFKFDDASPSNNRQTEIALIAAVGPIYITALVHRHDIEAAYPESTFKEMEKHVAHVDSEERRERGSEDEEIPQPPHPDAMPLIESDSFELYEYCRRRSRLPVGTWSKPFLLDTPPSDETLANILSWSRQHA